MQYTVVPEQIWHKKIQKKIQIPEKLFTICVEI